MDLELPSSSRARFPLFSASSKPLELDRNTFFLSLSPKLKLVQQQPVLA